MMHQRILITGAQGFIGRYLVAHWLMTNPETSVLGLGRSPRLDDYFTHYVSWGDARLRAPLPDRLGRALKRNEYRYVALNIQDKPSLITLLNEFRPTGIVHLAGSLRDEPLEQLVANNVVGTERLYEAIGGAAIDAPRVVLGSTGSLYGIPQPQELPLHEQMPCQPNELYAVSKRAAEDTARILSRRYGIPTMYARIFNVVGPGQEERHLCGWLASQFAAILQGLRPPRVEVGPLTTTRDFVDVRDVAQALYLLAAVGEAGHAYNIASGIETPVQWVYDQLLNLSGLDGHVELIQRSARSEDIPRLFADVNRLITLGYRPGYDLHASLDSVLHYYLDLDAAAVTQPGRDFLNFSE